MVTEATRKALWARSKGKCERCGGKLTKGQNDQVHHRDGNPKNNLIGNLRHLCRACHSELSAVGLTQLTSSFFIGEVPNLI